VDVSDERARILKLLEEGKITADQAARLIEALGTRAPHEPFGMTFEHGPRGRWRRRMTGDVDRIPDIVAHAVTSAMKSGFEPEEECRQDFADRRELSVRTVSGNVDVNGAERTGVSVTCSGGMTRARAGDKVVLVRSVSGDVEAAMPSEGSLEVEAVSGDVTVQGVSGRLSFKTVSGDLEVSGSSGELHARTVSGDVGLEQVKGSLEVESKSGDITVEAGGPVEGTLSTVSGDIDIELAPGADLVLELVCEEDGDISVEADQPHETAEEREGYTRVKFGTGSRRLVARTASADITVTQSKED
jgi:DUF4097 and DUF4098 domain-containing protein YvlB